MGIREIQVDVWTSDVMARARAAGAAGPAPDVGHQPCDARVGFSGYIPCINHGKHRGMHAGSVVV